MAHAETYKDQVLGALSPTEGKSALRVWRELDTRAFNGNLVDVRNTLRDLVNASCATFEHEDFYRVYFGIDNVKRIARNKRG